jgi:hypothetical protein
MLNTSATGVVGGTMSTSLGRGKNWELWLRAAAHGGTFFHLPEIGFDYRVRSDPMIVKMIRSIIACR